jgi:hypothetical protein
MATLAVKDSNGIPLFTRSVNGPQASAAAVQTGYSNQNKLVSGGGRGRWKRGGAFAANIITTAASNPNDIQTQLMNQKSLNQMNVQSSGDSVPLVKVGGRRRRITRNRNINGKNRTRKNRTRKSRTMKNRNKNRK